MSKIQYVNENINNINYFFKGKSETTNLFNNSGKNVNIFNFSFEDVNKSNMLLNNFISNKNFIDEELEKNSKDKKEIIKERCEIPLNKNDENKEKESKRHEKIIKELLQIINIPILKNDGFYNSPFKPLYQTKRISMHGKVIINDMNNDNNYDRFSI